MGVDRAEPLHLLVDSSGPKIYGEAKGSFRNTLSGRIGGCASYISAQMPTRMKSSGEIDAWTMLATSQQYWICLTRSMLRSR